MGKEKESVKLMWNDYIESIGESTETTDKTYEAWHFCNNEEDANALAELVLEGTKRATASLHESYAYEGEKIPEVGDHSIIIDWDGNAKCIIKTTVISIVPFKDVTEKFAATEGEGDKSLKYWRSAHLEFFGEECEKMSKEFNEVMLVICEEFEVVWK